MAVKIQLRRDISSNWTASNSLLSQGEIGIETNTLKLKIGDGITLWNALGYYSTSGNDIRWRGTWSGINTYLINDVVFLSGTSYICTTGHINRIPPNGSYWAILASQGVQGNKGDKGDTGSQGIQGIQGLKGDIGSKGDKGDTGDKGLQGGQGDKGDKGDIGATWINWDGGNANSVSNIVESFNFNGGA